MSKRTRVYIVEIRTDEKVAGSYWKPVSGPMALATAEDIVDRAKVEMPDHLFRVRGVK